MTVRISVKHKVQQQHVGSEDDIIDYVKSIVVLRFNVSVFFTNYIKVLCINNLILARRLLVSGWHVEPGKLPKAVGIRSLTIKNIQYGDGCRLK